MGRVGIDAEQGADERRHSWRRRQHRDRAGPPDADDRSDYFYDTVGRMNRITGPGLPAYGAVYSFVTDPATSVPRADLVGRIDFRTDAATTVASVEGLWQPVAQVAASVAADEGLRQDVEELR